MIGMAYEAPVAFHEDFTSYRGEAERKGVTIVNWTTTNEIVAFPRQLGSGRVYDVCKGLLN